MLLEEACQLARRDCVVPLTFLCHNVLSCFTLVFVATISNCYSACSKSLEALAVRGPTCGTSRSAFKLGLFIALVTILSSCKANANTFTAREHELGFLLDNKVSSVSYPRTSSRNEEESQWGEDDDSWAMPVDGGRVPDMRRFCASSTCDLPYIK
jgi:hypothetical protein